MAPTCIYFQVWDLSWRQHRKKELVNRIAENIRTRHVLVKAAVRQFFEEIISELVKGNRQEFRDFSVFDPKVSARRTARNPKTMEKVEVPAKRRVVFKPGRLMRERMNGQVRTREYHQTHIDDR